jgi:hypothetical protein
VRDAASTHTMNRAPRTIVVGTTRACRGRRAAARRGGGRGRRNRSRRRCSPASQSSAR